MTFKLARVPNYIRGPSKNAAIPVLDEDPTRTSGNIFAESEQHRFQTPDNLTEYFAGNDMKPTK